MPKLGAQRSNDDNGNLKGRQGSKFGLAVFLWNFAEVVVMPRSPRRGCAYGWCSRLAVDGERYCEEHLKKTNKQYEQYGRDPKTKKNYGRAWEKIRERFIRSGHVYCEMCLEEGRLTPTEHVHHKIPLSEGGTHDFSNLQALCKHHHSQVHALRGDRWGRPNEY